ncbi:class E sortase [Streptomyces sp. NPDC001744]|uniref:class E sortase n=1 Tax=Streptomyces sp. NPDC001744 TaxID=3364606 RepID=UPI0036745253
MTAGSPWFRDEHEPEQRPAPENGYAPADPYATADPYAASGPQPAADPYPPADPYSSAPAYAPTDPYAPAGPHAQADPYAQAGHHERTGPHARPGGHAQAGSYAPADPYGPADAYGAPDPYAQAGSYAPADPYPYEQSGARGAAPQEAPYGPSRGARGADEEPPAHDPAGTMVMEAVEAPSEPEAGPAAEQLPGPGRAERRRAAKGGRAKGRRGAPTAAGTGAAARPAAPLTRTEARRAAREAKDGVGVVASRIVGELFITLGVVMLLFVTYQLWWTNVLAGQETDQVKERIADTWSKERKDENKPEAFEPGEGFAIMYIPKLDVVVPIAEGIDKAKVLDKGMVGHYSEGPLKTAMPSDKQGNFAVAGHRNTHGEPFRYVNRLKPGDPIVVETRNTYYTYEMASILPQTPPSNVSVIEPVPKGSGFTGPGRYITLTTCTPEFTSTYRMIVWGRLVEERPRSKGKPEALVG